jgi:drug/metabolite transporter (DMT)-like permease
MGVIILRGSGLDLASGQGLGIPLCLAAAFRYGVTAILLGAFVLGEHISLREIVGALVIGSALLLIDGRVLKRFGR